MASRGKRTRPWSDYEDGILREMMRENLRYELIAGFMKRSRTAIKLRVRELGIARYPKPNFAWEMQIARARGKEKYD